MNLPRAYISRFEILAIYDGLSDIEVAMLIGMGGTLPATCHDRYGRMERAMRIYQSELAESSTRRTLPATDLMSEPPASGDRPVFPHHARLRRRQRERALATI